MCEARHLQSRHRGGWKEVASVFSMVLVCATCMVLECATCMVLVCLQRDAHVCNIQMCVIVCVCAHVCLLVPSACVVSSGREGVGWLQVIGGPCAPSACGHMVSECDGLGSPNRQL